VVLKKGYLEIWHISFFSYGSTFALCVQGSGQFDTFTKHPRNQATFKKNKNKKKLPKKDKSLPADICSLSPCNTFVGMCSVHRCFKLRENDRQEWLQDENVTFSIFPNAGCVVQYRTKVSIHPSAL